MAPGFADGDVVSRRSTDHPIARWVRKSRRRHSIRIFRSRLVQRVVYVGAALAGVQLYVLHLNYYQALRDKFSPTLFIRLSDQQKEISFPRRWQVENDAQHATRKELLDNRQIWKKLGSGYEGDTFVFNGSVIKVFQPDRSPLRNCVPGTTSRWPPEIPTSLLLGGLHDPNQPPPTGPNQSGFVPVLDYFLLPTVPSEHQNEWYLVTPFLESGTLQHLAERLQSREPPPTPLELDARFRPSFNRILQALDTMQSQHELCHDDIKMDNIFITNSISSEDGGIDGNYSHSPQSGQDAHWLLADLGNAREPSHSYHSSLLWTHDNGQHPDCRINDLIRLVKTYVMFLRAATAPTYASAQFEGEFLTASSPWSQLYWYIINSARGVLDGSTAAAHLHSMSTSILTPSDTEAGPGSAPTASQDPQKRGESSTAHDIFGPQSSWLDGIWSPLRSSSRTTYLVSRELNRGMGVSEKWAVVFGKMGIFQAPFRHC